jgi:hypothetical protein
VLYGRDCNILTYVSCTTWCKKVNLIFEQIVSNPINALGNEAEVVSGADRKINSWMKVDGTGSTNLKSN